VEAYICRTCGVQQAESEGPPSHCPICDDERQYVPRGGQRWVTLTALRGEGHRTELRELEPGLTGIGADPPVGIGQRALLVQTPAGNFLWDCFGFIDDEGIAAVQARGGLQGIAMSHPHFYGVCVEWSRAFGDAPIYIPTADRQWVMRPDPAVKNWNGVVEPLAGLTLIQSGGHFEGSAVLHWARGAAGDGATGVITAAFTNAFKAQAKALTVETVHPFASGDAHGLILFFVVVATLISTLASQAILFATGKAVMDGKL